MKVPIYAFGKGVGRPEYSRLGEEGRSEAWSKAVGELAKEEAEADVQTVLSCRAVGSGPTFLWVKKYPDMETYLKFSQLWWFRVGMHKYFDMTVELGRTDDDWKTAFGEIKPSKPTW